MNLTPFLPDVWATVADWRALSFRALRRMYLPEKRLFAFRIRRDEHGDHRLEGVSGRYTAIVLLALAGESEEVQANVFTGHTLQDVSNALIERMAKSDELGEVALGLWAAGVLKHPGAARVLQRLQEIGPMGRACPTVELAWCLTALVAPGNDVTDDKLATSLAGRLLGCFREESGLFSHHSLASGGPCGGLRGHVCCFADLVYPTQALSFYHRVTGHREALEAAKSCAKRMCELQGPQGQWWWHYDVRTGRVLEQYPVYSVHQDGMGPMALFALEDARSAGINSRGPMEHYDAVERSIRWLIDPPELKESLVDRQADVIWRKVARHEPGKLARTLQALASRVHPALRVPGLNVIFPPGWVDYETRPYHMGWLLYAFTPDRLKQLSATQTAI